MKKPTQASALICWAVCGLLDRRLAAQLGHVLFDALLLEALLELALHLVEGRRLQGRLSSSLMTW
jgi:hypothetical protein